jgi:hypothetical protein
VPFHAQTHFSFNEGTLYWYFRTVIASQGLLNPLVPFNSFKSSIGPAKSAIASKIASSMHEFREFADTDAVFKRGFRT